MSQEIENFVRFSIKYQILLAQHVSNKCQTKVYVFDKKEFFKDEDTIKIEEIEDIKTLFRDGFRSVLSLPAEKSFGMNQDLYLQYTDVNTVQEDDLGLYIVPIESEKSQVNGEISVKQNIESNDENEPKEIYDESKEKLTLKKISEAIEEIVV